MKRLFLSLSAVLILSGLVHAFSGVEGDIGKEKLWISSVVSPNPQIGILSTGCVVVAGFRVTESTGSNEAKIGFYQSHVRNLTGTLISSYSLTTDNHGFFNARASTGAVYNVIRSNTGVSVPAFTIYWDYLSPTCMPNGIQ